MICVEITVYLKCRGALAPTASLIATNGQAAAAESERTHPPHRVSLRPSGAGRKKAGARWVTTPKGNRQQDSLICTLRARPGSGSSG
jgi:hypothetical protein